ncbi:MAG: T9SS type A sorting domain-containing protein [Bacteroidia bacterium]
MKKFYVIASLALTVNASAQYTKLLDFAGTGVTIVGQQPLGTLCAASDGKLYGLTYQDGANNLGVLFQYNPTTNIYTKNLDFAGATNGSYPQGSLMQASDGMLYGMTSAGGANSLGVLFQYNPSTNVYTKKLDFAGATNGSNPIGSLMQASDGMLYGMTTAGGASGMGVLFQYNPSTNVYTKKLDFAGSGAAIDGSTPYGDLMQASDGMLYGMTSAGGTSTNCTGGCGVIFQWNSSTNVYTKKLDFAGTPNGSYPQGSLMQASDGMLYGMANQGGAIGMGVLFQYNPSTNVYTKKLDFAGASNGSTPYGDLMQASDGMLYGMTYAGGTSTNCTGGCGALFQYNPATNVYTKKIDFAVTVSTTTNGVNPIGSLMQASDGMLYGMTSAGGTSTNCTGGCGVIFQWNSSTNVYTKKLDFAVTPNGSTPYGDLMQASDGMLYGMTYAGGTYSNGMGVIFQYNPTTNVYTKKIDFTGTMSPAAGQTPKGSLCAASDGMLYGMTYAGGASGWGVLFQYNPATNVYTKKIDLSTVNAQSPFSNLMQASDGMLYGMTSHGGINGVGVIFQYDPVANTYTDKCDFAGTTNGQFPQGSLMQASDGMLYGMTPQGGTRGMGVLFQYNLATSTCTKLLDFAGSGAAIDGSTPLGSLIQASDGMLYGMTQQGGGAGYGVLFQYNPATYNYTKKLDFAGTGAAIDGSQPSGSLMQASDGMLYGMTPQGGTNNMGVLFKYGIGGTTGINQVTNRNEVSIYPNPAKEMLNVELGIINSTTTLQITDMLGNTHSTFKIQHSPFQISVADLSEGIYNVTISSNEGVVNKRVVIVR